MARDELPCCVCASHHQRQTVPCNRPADRHRLLKGPSGCDAAGAARGVPDADFEGSAAGFPLPDDYLFEPGGKCGRCAGHDDCEHGAKFMAGLQRRRVFPFHHDVSCVNIEPRTKADNHVITTAICARRLSTAAAAEIERIGHQNLVAPRARAIARRVARCAAYRHFADRRAFLGCSSPPLVFYALTAIHRKAIASGTPLARPAAAGCGYLDSCG